MCNREVDGTDSQSERVAFSFFFFSLVYFVPLGDTLILGKCLEWKTNHRLV